MPSSTLIPARGRRAAAWASEIFAPAVLLSALLLAVSLSADGPAGLLPGAAAVLFVTGLPLAAVLLLVRAGVLSDHHVSNRRQRAPVLAGTLVSIAAGSAVLPALGADRDLVLAVLSSVAGLIIVMVVNLAWKLSVHAAVSVFFCAGILVIAGLPALPVLVLPLLVGWSRVVLKAHTRAQDLAGYLVGAGIGVLFWALLR
jgi:membrane-associated phospholipid phosphatase